MKRINEAIAEQAGRFTRGQQLLAHFISEHCDKAAFMSSFDLAAVTGVSQSTVIRFASALGYGGYGAFQEALQLELKYRLTTLERFELEGEEVTSDQELLSSIAMHDGLNIKKNLSLNPLDAMQNLCTRLVLAGKVYLFGQNHAAAAAEYLFYDLRLLLPNVTCLNQTGLDPLAAGAGMGPGDLLLCFSLPPHRRTTMELLTYAREMEVCTAVVSESHESDPARDADISLVVECGDGGLGGSMAPLISLCGMLLGLVARSDEKSQKKLSTLNRTGAFERKETL